MSKAIRCMKDLTIFSTLDVNERNKIGELACKRFYAKNEFLFREGDPADTIYLIKSGKVKLFKVSSGGKEIILDILKDDDFFGENTFFDQAQHNMNAQAMENAYVCSCTKEHFALLLQNPKTSMKIIQLLGEKLNNYTNQVASIAFHDVKGRVAAMLLKLAGEYGSSSLEGTTINIELTHNDLASLVNASRVMVSNVVGSLRQDGIIETKDHRFILLDLNALASAMDNTA
ncbi:MAG: Crp/Fnr family transcriptional regulator [Clostridia bacterium]|nr:Crp/Fnr family transcriptional regulator [Clostridia bacterium]